MARHRRLTAISRLAALAAALCLAGCAGTYAPAYPAPEPAKLPPAPEPAVSGPDDPAPPGTAPDPAPAPRAEGDPRTPTLALLRQSERSEDGGDLAGAIAYVERAIRLNGRDAGLWLRLARLQLSARRPETAEQLAQKAIALAADGTDQQRQGWLVVADAVEAQGDAETAARIRARWRTFRG